MIRQITPSQAPPASSAAPAPGKSLPSREAFAALLGDRAKSLTGARHSHAPVPLQAGENMGGSLSAVCPRVHRREARREQESGSEGRDQEEGLEAALASARDRSLAATPLPVSPALPVPVGSAPDCGQGLSQRFELVSRCGLGPGLLRLEIGRGALRGATVIIRGEGKTVSLKVDGPSDGAARELEDRARARLVARGFEVESD